MNIKLTFLSDTHSKHNHIPIDHFNGGDILLHSGDISSQGYEYEVRKFLKWFDSIPNYTHKVFIAGNHDWLFQRNPKLVKEIMKEYSGRIHYLQDSHITIDGVKIYGSPWQPEFYNWAFNLPRNGEDLEGVWSKIPDDTDILLTHGPAYGLVDKVIGRYQNLGCEKLAERIEVVQPTLHVCGHIHSGNGVDYNDQTTHINASVLNERYDYTYKPYNIELNLETKEVEIIV
jgi:Icc-related predicted phosphoesterase